MISIITPTNGTQHLAETWGSLLAQRGPVAWEWLIVPNGETKIADLLPLVDPRDERVHAVPAPSGLTGVGALKRFTCEQARGEIVVELDHDDLLTPDALAHIARRFESDPALGLAYSDFAEFEDGSWAPRTYDRAYGWRYLGRSFYEHKFEAAIAFPPDAATMNRIEFAPNHVRAWRASEYWRIGGHDATLPLADDFDLVCRFYLGSKVAHIPECLYLYRRHDDQTSVARNAELQPYAAGVSNRYRYALVERWADLEGLAKIDLGAAHDRPAGWIGIDQREGAGVDLYADLARGLPFADSSVGAIRAHDFLEHLPDKVGTINEIWRVLKPGGWLLSMTPSTDGRGAFQDPTHVSYWNENSFWYYTDARYAAYVPAIRARFQAAQLRTTYPTPWHREHAIPYVEAALIALKDGYRPPGEVRWPS